MRTPRRLLKGLLVAFVVSLILALYPAYRTYNYVQHDPTFCRSCHIMDYAYMTWTKSEHKDISCKNCHIQNPYDRGRIAFKALEQEITGTEAKIGRHTTLDKTVCQTCHYSEEKNIPQVAETAGHKKHIGYLNFQCTTCHYKSSNELHVFRPSPEKCITCHPNSSHNAEGMKDLSCTTCHAFLDKKSTELLPARITCLSCHENMQVKDEIFPVDAPMSSFDCQTCHAPHKQTLPLFTTCLNCHEDILTNRFHLQQGTKGGLTTCWQSNCHRPHDFKPHISNKVFKEQPH